MSTSAIGWLRIAGAVLIVAALLRAGRVAWDQRELVRGVWRSVTWRHLLGGLAVLVGLVAVLQVLLTVAPVTRHGLGDLVGFTGNAAFLPLEEAAAAAGPPPARGPDVALIAIASVFLLPLLAILPWLAFAEEELFRAGLEVRGVTGEVTVALVFGLAHLVMLVPLAAALAVGGAGFVYGRVYRAAVRARVVPPVFALTAYRPTRRARAAVAGAADAPTAHLGVGDALLAYERQAAGVFAATVLHTVVNAMVIALVYGSIVLYALRR